MGKRKLLTSIDCGRIFELHKQDLSQSVIASEIGTSKTVIANFLKDPDALERRKSYWPALENFTSVA